MPQGAAMHRVSSLKSLVCGIAFCWCAQVCAALPGVTEFDTAPEKLTDAQLSALIGTRVTAADVIAIGETVHGSAGLLNIQTRLMRYLVTRHGLRLIVWENPVLRSLELERWVASCTKAKTPAPLQVLYLPTAADAALWDWVCDYNRAHPDDTIVFRGMDVWDRPWEHYARIQALGTRTGVDAQQLKSIRALCPAHDAANWPAVEAIFEKQRDNGKFVPAADYEKCRALLTTLLEGATRTATARKKQKDTAADEAFDLALSASTLLGWLGFYHHETTDDILSWNARDRAQGMNLMLVMAQHGVTRAILAAHTSHVSHNRSAADWWGYGDLKSGVYFYTALSGRKVFNIALTAYEASGAQGHWSLPTASNSLDKKLHDAGHRFAYFGSSAAFLSQHKKWWMQNQNFPRRYESGVEIAPGDHFDAWFFLARSHLDKALPQRPMWQP
jgi:erythromycin esterase-like protein